MYVLAIDQGTSATKALVVDDDGRVLASVERAVHVTLGPHGAVEQDPEALWESVRDAGAAAVARAGVPIGACGVANQGETILAWERTSGRPLSAAISWQDRRATAICDARRDHASMLLTRTGLPLDPYFAAPKMCWLRERGTTGGVCTTSDAWLLHRLTGAFVTDAATASRTLLLDLGTTEWAHAACAVFAIDPAALPRIVDCAAVIGETSAFGGTIPVAGLAVDQQAALFAQGCRTPGDAKCTYGTGAFLLATVGATPRRSTAGLAACVAWRLDGASTYCLDGQVYTAGAAVTWLTRLGLLSAATDLDAVAASVPDAGGVVFVPALAGHAAPFWRPSARGSFTGLALATTAGHLVRAVIEGIAAQVAWVARAVEHDLGHPLRRLRVDGGLSASLLLLQTQADLLQAPVELYADPHATAFGVAALARLGVGAAASAADAVPAWTPVAVFTPRIAPATADERLHHWRTVAEATMGASA